MKLEQYLTPYTEINSKWIKELKAKTYTIKLLEEKIRKTLLDINHSKIVFEPSHRIRKIKTKINKWDLIKLKSFCTTKKTISKTKIQPMEWEKIFANGMTDRGYYQKYVNSSYNSISKKQTTQSKHVQKS